MSKRYYYDELGEDIYDEQIDDYPSIETICETLNKQAERIAELEEQLKNAIVPKFKQYQQVSFINNNGHIINKYYYECECQDGIIVAKYSHSKGVIVYYKKAKDLVFATKEEAQAKLRELQGE